MTSFERLQCWFLSQCNGDWEHGLGISVSTLDNPGWQIQIDLEGSTLEETEFPKTVEMKSAAEWIHASREGNLVKISCNPEQFDRALAIFCDWAGA